MWPVRLLSPCSGSLVASAASAQEHHTLSRCPRATRRSGSPGARRLGPFTTRRSRSVWTATCPPRRARRAARRACGATGSRGRRRCCTRRRGRIRRTREPRSAKIRPWTWPAAPAAPPPCRSKLRTAPPRSRTCALVRVSAKCSSSGRPAAAGRGAARQRACLRSLMRSACVARWARFSMVPGNAENRQPRKSCVRPAPLGMQGAQRNVLGGERVPKLSLCLHKRVLH